MEISTSKTFKKWIYHAYTLAFSHSSISIAVSMFIISVGFLQLTLLWIEEAVIIYAGGYPMEGQVPPQISANNCQHIKCRGIGQNNDDVYSSVRGWYVHQ
jgi:hypothetical protein